MQVKDLDSIFGLPMTLVKQGSSKYRLVNTVCIIIDICIIVASGISLYDKGSPIVMMELCVLVGVILSVVAVTITESDNKESYRVYNKLKRRNYQSKVYNIDAEKLYSVLFCSGYKKIKTGDSLDTYREALNSACMTNKKYARRVLRNIEKYEDENGNLKIVSCGRYYLDSKEV